MGIRTKPTQDKFNFSMLLGLDGVLDMKRVKPIEHTEYNPKMCSYTKTLLHCDSSIE